MLKISIHNKEFGATSFLQDISSDIIDCLKKFYGKDGESIFVLAANRLIYQASFKKCESKFKKSFLSKIMKNADLGKNNLAKMLKRIGNDREMIADFMKNFIVGTRHIIFDATESVTLQNGRKRYSEKRLYRPYGNLFCLFSVDEQMPIYYKMFSGKISGTKAFKDSLNDLNELNLNDCIAIESKDLYLEKNIALLEEAGLKYIMRLNRDSKLIHYERLNSSRYAEAFDGYFFHQAKLIFYTCLELKDGRRTVIFTDRDLEVDEENSYLIKVNYVKEGYNIEEYNKIANRFGTITIITNDLEKSEKEIYESYDSKIELESVLDTYKTLLEEDRSYMQSEESMETWIFINHIATMMYYKVLKLLKAEDLLKTTSPYDLLDELADVRKIKIKTKWELTEITKKTEKLIKKLNIQIT